MFFLRQFYVRTKWMIPYIFLLFLFLLNPFLANVPILYHLKTQQNVCIFRVFRGY